MIELDAQEVLKSGSRGIGVGGPQAIRQVGLVDAPAHLPRLGFQVLIERCPADDLARVRFVQGLHQDAGMTGLEEPSKPDQIRLRRWRASWSATNGIHSWRLAGEPANVNRG